MISYNTKIHVLFFRKVVLLFFLFSNGGYKLWAQNNVSIQPKEIKYPQINFGLKLGFNLATFRGVEVKNASTQVGFSGGPFVNFKFHKRFSLINELFYTQKSASAVYTLFQQGDTLGSPYLTTVRNDARLIFKCVSLSAYGKYHFVNGRDYSSFIMFGPVFSYIPQVQITGTTDVFISDLAFFDAVLQRKAKVLIDSYDIKPEQTGLNFTKFDFGLTIGGGTTYNVGFGKCTFDMRYTLGLPDVDKSATTLHAGEFMVLLGFEF